MKTLALLFFLALAFDSGAQRGVRLTSRVSKRQKFILEGTRVIYQYANSNHPAYVTYTRYGQPVYHGIIGVGILKIVNDSTIQVDDEVIRTKDVMTFGEKKKGAWVGSFLLYWGGLGMMLGSISHNSDTHQPEINAPLMTLGAGCMVAGLVDVISRSPKNMNVWRLEVAK